MKRTQSPTTVQAAAPAGCLRLAPPRSHQPASLWESNLSFIGLKPQRITNAFFLYYYLLDEYINI